MNAATTRSIIAAAGLAAMGLVAWPHQTTPLAQQAVPTVHRDVALVDATVDADISADNAFWNSFLGPTGAEEQLFTGLGGGSIAQALLDTNTANPAFSGDFNGAESRFVEGLFVTYIAGEDEFNQLFGLESGTAETAAQAAFANDILNVEFVPIPHSLEPGFTLDPGAAFDTDLMTLAAAEFASASSDFTGYLADLPTNLAGLF
jgi:hypothetical protein